MRLSIVVAAVASLLSVGCFDARVSPGAEILCAAGNDCPDARVCLHERCVAVDENCLVVDGRDASVAADGSVCGLARICVAGACVVPRCGDGVVSVGEGCDDGPDNADGRADACRTTCALPRCGDGVVDDGEVCDGIGCSADCGKVAVCGDGIVDSGEACDDANDNPRDGCDACALRPWTSRLLVSGSLEGRNVEGLPLARPTALAVDVLGRLYVGETNDYSVSMCRVRRIDPDGSLTVVAGNGQCGRAGEGGAATGAQLEELVDVAVDALGNVWLNDGGRVLRVRLDGRLERVRGLDGARAIAVDRRGRLVASTTSGLVRVGDDGTLASVALVDVAGAPVAPTMTSIAFDGGGDLVFTDGVGVHRVDELGVMTTVAADLGGVRAFSLAVDHDGVVWCADQARVVRVDVDGSTSIAMGTGGGGYAGDGGPATEAHFASIRSLAVDRDGRLLVADSYNHRVRRLEPSGIVTTVLGTGVAGFVGDEGPATSAELDPLDTVAVAPDGSIYISEEGYAVRRIDRDGFITTIAGTRTVGCDGEGGPAAAASIDRIDGIDFDSLGRAYLVDVSCAVVWRVELDGTLTRFAGVGRNYESSGDGGLAVEANFYAPTDVVVDDLDRVVIAEDRVRRVELDGSIVTIAGGGAAPSFVDGMPARDAPLDPEALAFDPQGLLVIASFDGRIVRLEDDGTLTRLAGTGTFGVVTEGMRALDAPLFRTRALGFDGRGRLYLVVGDVVARVDEDGVLRWVGGGAAGGTGNTGDGGPALAARMDSVVDLAVEPDGSFWVTIGFDCRLRHVDADGTITTVAGFVHPPGPGRFDRARLYESRALAVLDGDVVSVGGQGRALRLDLADEDVRAVVGIGPGAAPSTRAAFAPLLQDARGVAFDADARTLAIVEGGLDGAPAALRFVDVDVDGDGVIDDEALWQARSVRLAVDDPAGIAWDVTTNSFLLVDHGDHCVRHVDRAGALVDVVAGVCGARGAVDSLLNSPTHAIASPSTAAVYVADTGNQRVVRVDNGAVDVVVGDGSASSAGEGRPSRLFPVDEPGQLALDGDGNLYVASRTTVRLVANVDDDADADGDDRVLTIFGGGARGRYPESDARCVRSLVVRDDGRVLAADACQGFVVVLQAPAP